MHDANLRCSIVVLVRSGFLRVPQMGFQGKCDLPTLPQCPHISPTPMGGLYVIHGFTPCTCPTEKSQDGCVAFVTLSTGSASLAFMSFISQARLKGPLSPGTVPVTEVVGASVGPNGDGGAGCGAQCPRGSAAALFSSRLCGEGLEPGFPHCLTRLPENNMLFPLLPGCARAVFTVGERGLYYFSVLEPPSL